MLVAHTVTTRRRHVRDLMRAAAIDTGPDLAHSSAIYLEPGQRMRWGYGRRGGRALRPLRHHQW